jgi:hypothetical protein
MKLKASLLTALAGTVAACSASINARQVAQLRGAARPDSIDVLIAHALASKGEFREMGDMAYGFTGSYAAIEALSRMPTALPRLVDCMGWDLRARATYDGRQLLAGVVCFQGIVHSQYFQRRNQHGWPNGFSDSAFVDYTDPSLHELRTAQRGWREQLLRDPP